MAGSKVAHKHRRAFLAASAQGALVLALAGATASSRAQRPTNPIARPPRPAGPIGAGRFPGLYDGVNRVELPGVYVVRAVNERDNLVQLGDSEGRTADVLVDPHVFELSDLKPGDELVVDFLAPEGNNAPLRAGGMWKK